MVMEYLCLYWGTDNSMYTNYCIYQEDVSDPNPANHKIAGRPPCRSFCTQVATTCSNDENFIQLCSDIICPPTDSKCTPDPLINGETLGANLGCDLPYSQNPYIRVSAASKTLSNQWISVWILLFGIIIILANDYIIFK